MHNGTLATLEDVLRFYDEGRSRTPTCRTLVTAAETTATRGCRGVFGEWTT